MKRIFFSGLLVITAIYLTACAGPDEQQKKIQQHRYGYEGQEQASNATQTTPPPDAPADNSAGNQQQTARADHGSGQFDVVHAAVRQRAEQPEDDFHSGVGVFREIK